MIRGMFSSSPTILQALVPFVLALLCQVGSLSKTTAASTSSSSAYVTVFGLASTASGNAIQQHVADDTASEFSGNGDSSGRYSISNKVQPPKVPTRGPLPSEVVPDTSAIEGPQEPVPLLLASCGDDAGPPVVYDLRVHNPLRSYERWSVLKGTAKHPCEEQNQYGGIRFRLLSYSKTMMMNGTARVRTAVIPGSVQPRFDQNEITFVLPVERCGPRLVYFDACVRRRADNAILCATSNIIYARAPEVEEPLLAFRPPFKLELAPGDQAKLKMRITNSTNETDGFTNDEDQKFAFFTKPVISKNNYTLSNYPYTTAHSVVASLPPNRNCPGKAGVTPALNGALVYLRFVRQSCIVDSGTYEQRYATQIIVKSSIRSLVRQDTKLPEFETPLYPPTVVNTPVTIEVKAVNCGGGLREGNMTTELHYQWYVRTSAHAVGTFYANPIINATLPTLTLAKAECGLPCHSRFGTINLREYYVDVCNTFGCRRSAKIKPNVLPPSPKPGLEWDKSRCGYKNRSTYCSSLPFCQVNGVVRPCHHRN